MDFRFTLVQLCAGWSSLFDISTFWYEINFDLLSCLSLLSCCCTFSLFESSQLACWLSYHGIRSKLYNPPWSVDTSFLQIRVARSPSQSLQMYQIEVGFVTPSFLICGSTRWRLTCYLLYFQLLRQTCLQVLNKTFWRSSSATSFNMFQAIPNNSHLSFNRRSRDVTWPTSTMALEAMAVPVPNQGVSWGHGGQRVSVSCAMSTLGRPIWRTAVQLWKHIKQSWAQKSQVGRCPKQVSGCSSKLSCWKKSDVSDDLLEAKMVH